MSHGIWAAASGATAQITQVDIIANNAANATTAGYRADRALFSQVLVEAQDGTLATRSLSLARIDGVTPDSQLGTLKHTGRELDVALTDPSSFLSVSTPTGERYTRAGDLRLSGAGQLVTQRGEPLMGGDRRPIQLAADAQHVAITRDGRVLVDGNDSGQRLRVVRVDSPEELTKEGHTLYRARGAAPAEELAPQLQVGSLELSNAPPVRAMHGLVGATRHFELMNRVIEAFSEVDKQAATQIAGG